MCKLEVEMYSNKIYISVNPRRLFVINFMNKKKKNLMYYNGNKISIEFNLGKGSINRGMGIEK
jgi:hypothetical protein